MMYVGLLLQNGQEVSGASYERLPFPEQWEGDSTSKTNVTGLVWPEATEDWGDVWGIGIFETSESAECLLRIELKMTATEIVARTTVHIDPGSLRFENLDPYRFVTPRKPPPTIWERL